MDNKISVVINTYNASQYLRAVLESLRAFDEILICDMESTDATVDIAKEYGCRVVTFPKGDYNICEPARDFAIHSASHRWVLVVDVDEIVPEELRQYLYNAISDKAFDDAFAVPRLNSFMGEQYKENTDYQIRFFQKDKATWPPTIHSHPQIQGSIVRIPAEKGLCLIHLDNPSVSQRVGKMNVYTDNELARRGVKRYSALSLLFRPVWFFLRTYLFKGGIRHGRKGIVKSYFSSIYQMLLMAKMVEKEQEGKS